MNEIIQLRAKIRLLQIFNPFYVKENSLKHAGLMPNKCPFYRGLEFQMNVVNRATCIF